MNWKRGLAILGVIAGAALLAFPLRGAVNQLIVIPLAYVLWALQLVYLSLPQVLWWIGIVVVVLIILGKSLLPDEKTKKKIVPIEKAERGRVESLAASIQRSNRGIYFKWVVANFLGKLAFQILRQREHGKPRSVFAPLVGDGWEPTPEVQAYLEKGLHGSFTEFPNSHWNFLKPPVPTALDHELEEVVEFLESKM